MIILPRAVSNGNPQFSLKVLDATLKKIKGIVCGFPLKRFDSIKKILQGILFRLPDFR